MTSSTLGRQLRLHRPGRGQPRAAGVADLDGREVIADPQARYYGAELGERTLLPGDDAQIAKTHFEDWLRESATGT